MNYIQLEQISGLTGQTYTLTWGGQSTTLASGTPFSALIRCDSLTINRTGSFTPVTVTPENTVQVVLTDGQPVISDTICIYDLAFFFALAFWAWLYSLLRP